LRVLLIDDGAHHIGLIHDELSRQGHLVVGVLDTALLIHDCVLRLQPDVVIVDSECERSMDRALAPRAGC
jgi:response regulator NasT